VRGREVALDEEAIVLGIEDCGLVLLAGERLHGVERVPEREHHELGPVVDGAAEHPDTPVSERLRVARDPRLAHELRVGVAVSPSNRSSPDPGDHPQS
jgi:hypothetical protein